MKRHEEAVGVTARDGFSAPLEIVLAAEVRHPVFVIDQKGRRLGLAWTQDGDSNVQVEWSVPEFDPLDAGRKGKYNPSRSTFEDPVNQRTITKGRMTAVVNERGFVEVIRIAP